MSLGHGHGPGHAPVIAEGGLLTAEDLEALVGDAGTRRWVGDARSEALLAEQAAIVTHQWRHGIRRGLVKGFLLSGPPGVGKTTLARRLAFELGRRFPRTEAGSASGADHLDGDAAPRRDGLRAGGGVVTALVDGSEIARAKYGESEQHIREIFRQAGLGFGAPGARAVVVFDDVESVLLRRDDTHAKEWHFSQDSVFFHVVDDLDTSRTILVLTTNRPDLVDEAIRDRFLEYSIDYPPADVLAGVVRERAGGLGWDGAMLDTVESRLREEVDRGAVRSLRDAEHLLMRCYVADVRSRG